MTWLLVINKRWRGEERDGKRAGKMSVNMTKMAIKRQHFITLQVKFSPTNRMNLCNPHFNECDFKNNL